MQRKRTWMRCLLIGISLLIISLSGCGEGEVEYRIDNEFVFINESNSTITFTILNRRNADIRTEVSLAPNEKDTVLLLASGGAKHPNPDSCCQGLLHAVLDGSDRGNIRLRFDDKACLITEPAIISNYTNEVLGPRFFRYIFVFTDEILGNTTDCQ